MTTREALSAELESARMALLAAERRDDAEVRRIAHHEQRLRDLDTGPADAELSALRIQVQRLSAELAAAQGRVNQLEGLISNRIGRPLDGMSSVAIRARLADDANDLRELHRRIDELRRVAVNQQQKKQG